MLAQVAHKSMNSETLAIRTAQVFPWSNDIEGLSGNSLQLLRSDTALSLVVFRQPHCVVTQGEPMLLALTLEYILPQLSLVRGSAVYHIRFGDNT